MAAKIAKEESIANARVARQESIASANIKSRYINEHRLMVVTHIISAMIMDPEIHDRCSPLHASKVALDIAFELALELLDRESDLQAEYEVAAMKRRGSIS